MPELKQQLEDTWGADTPQGLLFLDTADIESMATDGAQRTTLLAAIGRIEPVEDGADAALAEVAARSGARSGHGHLLQIDLQEIEQERPARARAANHTEAESSAAAATRRLPRPPGRGVATQQGNRSSSGRQMSGRVVVLPGWS